MTRSTTWAPRALSYSLAFFLAASTTALAQYCAGTAPNDAFEDISNQLPIALGDDDSIMCWDPATFPLFGTNYDNIVIGSNGYVTWTNYGVNIACGATPVAGGTDPNNTALPDPAAPNAVIAPFWDDLDPSAAGAVYSAVWSGPPGGSQRLVVQWDDVPHASGGNGGTFQVQMENATGDIVFCYQDVDFGNAAVDFGAGATVGIEDGTGANGLQVSLNAATLSNNSCIHLYANCSCNDVDGDGYGDPASPTCTFPQLDCDDSDPAVNPSATEVCDGIDNNCAFGIDETFDTDIDGWTTCAGDCDDNNAAVNPGMTEIPLNGIDDDCNPATPANPACMSIVPDGSSADTSASPIRGLAAILPLLALTFVGRRLRRRAH